MSGGDADRLVLISDIAEVRQAQDRFGFADAVRVGDTIWVSGVIADRRTEESGFEPAFERAFARLSSILTRAGARWGDVVEISSYHIDPVAQIESFAAVKARYVGAPFPAWTAVGTTALLRPDGIAEIKLVARIAG